MIQSTNQSLFSSTHLVGNKADQVMACVIDWLKSGQLSIGDKLPTEKDLAKKFGVSLQTVNKAMSRLEDASLISRSTGKGSHVARLPARDAIAVICDIKHIAESYHAPSSDRLLENLICESKSLKLIPHFLVGRGKDASEYLQSLGMESEIWLGIKGVISKGWRKGLEESFDERGIPMVTISTKDQGRHAVTPDYRELGRLAARRLLSCGARRVCVLDHRESEDADSWNDPIESFKEELSRAQFARDGLTILKVGGSPEEAARALPGFEGQLLQADGIFITDDNTASGVAKWLEDSHPNLKPGAKVVTHANRGLDLGLPESFERISFDMAQIAAKSLDALIMLRSGALDAKSRSRVWIKPDFERKGTP